jgi:hypothetical protein
MLAMIPNTRFRPSSIFLTIRRKGASPSHQKRSFGLSFKPRHSMIESRLDLAIGPRSDVAPLNRAAKFIECLPHDFSSLLCIAGIAFVINR